MILTKCLQLYEMCMYYASFMHIENHWDLWTIIGRHPMINSLKRRLKLAFNIRK